MGDTVIIGCYANPNNKLRIVETILWHADDLMKKGYKVIIAGDLNYEMTALQDLMKETTLRIAKGVTASRTGRAGKTNIIDHIIYSSDIETFTALTLANISKSDHLPIKAAINISAVTTEMEVK